MTQSYKLTIEEICRKLRPVFGRKIDEIYLKYAMADSREEKEEIAQILHALYERNLSKLLDNSVLLEPPLEEQMNGEYKLATISYAGKKLFDFNLREKDWIRHVCISGMSGSGKTTLAFHILKNFIEKGKPFLIFDWKKSFRPLMLVDSEIMCFTIGNDFVSNLFKLNINKPPLGVQPKEWINVLCDLLAESFFASYGVHKVLLETLDDAFKEYGIYKGSRDYPTWNYIKWRLETKLEKTKGREAGWIESALRIASVLTFGDFGKVLNYKGKQSIGIEELLDKKVLFELNALGNVEKKFFCEFVLTYIYKLRKAEQSVISQDFEHAILVDEAHNIFLKDKTHFVSESVTDMVYREMREYGTSLICLDQHISKLSDTVKGNSACHISFQQQLPQDIWDISGIMQLSDRKEFFSKLPVGSAIVKLSERYTNPFLIEVEPVSLRTESVNDENIKEKMQFIFDGREIEQGNDEFSRAVKGEIAEKKLRVPNHALYNEEFSEVNRLKASFKEQVLEPVKETQTDILKNIKEKLTSEQQILYEFVEEKSAQGWGLSEIEEFMESKKKVGEYTSFDISKAISHALENRIVSKGVTTCKEIQNKKVYKDEKSIFHTGNTGLSDEQKRFIAFLQANPNHELSTTELYKILGLSARKGNKIKDELLQENKVKIQEIKFDKGWKKIIKINY